MVKNIHLVKATKIHLGTGWKKCKACLCRLGSSFSRQHDVEFCAQVMKIEHVTRRIVLLSLAERGSTPVGGLLLFRDLDPEQLGTQVLQTVPVGVGPTQLRGDFGAVDRAVDRTYRMRQSRQVETGEMKQLGDSSIRQQSGEAGRRLRRVGQLHEMRIAIAR